MTEAPKIEEIRAALGGDPRIGFPGVPIKISILEQAVVLEGEVRDVAAKKVALERVAAVRDVGGIVDRLHVAPAEQQADAEITDRVKDAFLQEPAFREVALRTMDKGRLVAQYEPIGARGKIDIEVGDGVVTLNGTLSGLERKRLAGVLAWWVPGSRDVVNGIVVEPPQVDTDDLMREAVYISCWKRIPSSTPAKSQYRFVTLASHYAASSPRRPRKGSRKPTPGTSSRSMT